MQCRRIINPVNVLIFELGRLYTGPQSRAILQRMQHCKSQVILFYSLEIVGKVVLETKYQTQLFQFWR